MRVMVFYKVESDHARSVIDFIRDVKRQSGYDIEEIDPETAEGSHLSQVYDIVEYPTIVATNDEGIMQKMWRGTMLPTISEVGYYASLD